MFRKILFITLFSSLVFSFNSFANVDFSGDVYVKCEIRQVIDFRIKMSFSKAVFNLGRSREQYNSVASRTLQMSVHKLNDFSSYFSNNFVLKAELDKKNKKILLTLMTLEKKCNCAGKKLSYLSINYQNGLPITDLYFMSSKLGKSLNDLQVKCLVRDSNDIRAWESN